MSKFRLQVEDLGNDVKNYKPQMRILFVWFYIILENDRVSLRNNSKQFFTRRQEAVDVIEMYKRKLWQKNSEFTYEYIR
ncbi:MAG: hypothetical protein H6Q20_1347 [Bacteroidetes bacterium]|jgi:hypothetical protein|nr:hypothetical protein [Bacteroidota bacterium]